MVCSPHDVNDLPSDGNPRHCATLLTRKLSLARPVYHKECRTTRLLHICSFKFRSVFSYGWLGLLHVYA